MSKFVLIIVSVSILVSLFQMFILRQTYEDFKTKAVQALGTEDFEIEVTDCLVAKTRDGRQYPSEQTVANYRWTKLCLAVVGMSVMFTVIVCVNKFTKEW